jgi:hypothetical protein
LEEMQWYNTNIRKKGGKDLLTDSQLETKITNKPFFNIITKLIADKKNYRKL